MKILHLSTNDYSGGAARAAFRIHEALLLNNIESSMRVLNKSTTDKSINSWMRKSILKDLQSAFHRRWLTKIKHSWSTKNQELHSFGRNGTGIVEEINNSNADIVHLHWISGLLSIAEIGNIEKPIVWTMHDMWPFCGAEHYAAAGEDRFKVGYHAYNRPAGEKGPDLCKRAFDQKKKYWADLNITVVPTTNWLFECVESSFLFKKRNKCIIPYPLDMQYPWVIIPQEIARRALQLPVNAKLILMGADGGTKNPRKGGDLLFQALKRVYLSFGSSIELMIFGESEPEQQIEYPFKVHWLGDVKDDRILALAYSAADVMVVPSRQEAFGLTALESMACGTPVVAFDVGGLPDIVQHKVNGWLATPFDTDSLAEGILWVLSPDDLQFISGVNVRNSVLKRFSPKSVADHYRQLYNYVLESN